MAKNRRPLLIVLVLLGVAALGWYLLARHARPPSSRSTATSTCARWSCRSTTASASRGAGAGGRSRQAGAAAGAARHQPARAAGGPGRGGGRRAAGGASGCITAIGPRRSRRRAPMWMPRAADADNAQRAIPAHAATCPRARGGRAVSRQDMDAAKAALDTAEARLAVESEGAGAGASPARARRTSRRREAQLRADQAQLALLQQQLKDAELLRAARRAWCARASSSPAKCPRRSKSAFTLAIIDPKWVRAYVDEPDLGSVHEGMQRRGDGRCISRPALRGWVGFISPVAEFTPEIGGDHGAALEPGVRDARVRARPGR